MTMLKAMMRRKTDIFICTLAVLLMLPLCNVMAQSKEIRKKIESIKENRAYKYGEGSGTTFDEAYKFALEKMMESINVFVASTYSLSQKKEEAMISVSMQTAIFPPIPWGHCRMSAGLNMERNPKPKCLCMYRKIP